MRRGHAETTTEHSRRSAEHIREPSSALDNGRGPARHRRREPRGQRDVPRPYGGGEGPAAGAEVTFRYAWEAEKTHAGLYAKAKEYADQQKDAPLAQIGVCDVCGWTFEGEAPDQCPVCKAKKDKFSLFQP
jgi:rubrerythrin